LSEHPKIKTDNITAKMKIVNLRIALITSNLPFRQ